VCVCRECYGCSSGVLLWPLHPANTLIATKSTSCWMWRRVTSRLGVAHPDNRATPAVHYRTHMNLHMVIVPGQLNLPYTHPPTSLPSCIRLPLSNCLCGILYAFVISSVLAVGFVVFIVGGLNTLL
jgi:hypothetical protein